MSQSLREEVVQSYYQTTAGRSHATSKEYYEQAAKGLMHRLRLWIPQDRKTQCLELACGCGETLYLLERLGFEYTVGVDLCQEELDQAKCNVKSRLICEDALSYLRQCSSSSVGFIIALNFLEHLSKDTLLAILTEARRVLQPGGTLVAMVPNAISPFGGLTRHWDITHEWAFTPNNFRQLAALIGFNSEIEFRECGPVAHGIISAS